MQLDCVEHCPYCRGEAAIDEYDPVSRSKEFIVRCRSCGALGPAKGTEDEAVKSWNVVSKKAG